MDPKLTKSIPLPLPPGGPISTPGGSLIDLDHLRQIFFSVQSSSSHHVAAEVIDPLLPQQQSFLIFRSRSIRRRPSRLSSLSSPHDDSPVADLHVEEPRPHPPRVTEAAVAAAFTARREASSRVAIAATVLFRSPPRPVFVR
uniref:Uncharacterized protein n=1 Tax=Arundo donax TaxID=35708 RepID=A0A0A9CT01_ARUDO